MRAVVCAVAMVLPLLGGCEMLEESYLVEQDVLIDNNGVQVSGDLEEDFFGSRWRQFRAYNSNAFSVCVRLALDAGAQTSGHAMGVIHKLGPSASLDVGYVTEPARYSVDARVWRTNARDECGSPPA